MQKVFIIAGIGIGIAVIATIAILSLSESSPEASLQQIVDNKDCAGFVKWEENNMFNESIELSPKLQEDAMKLYGECGVKALQNTFGSSTTTKTNEDPIKSLQQIIVDQDCQKFEQWTSQYKTDGIKNIPDELNEEKEKMHAKCLKSRMAEMFN